MSDPQRREFLAGAAALAATTAALTGAAPAEAAQPEPGGQPLEPVRGTLGAPLLGPSNPAREAQSPDRLRPPVTDSGTLPTLRWSFADSRLRYCFVPVAGVAFAGSCLSFSRTGRNLLPPSGSAAKHFFLG